jgi:hypothetical protein
MTGWFAANELEGFRLQSFLHLGYRTSMTKPSDPSVPFPDADAARTRRQLRFVKALFKIDDPEVEQALAVIVDRLAQAGQPANSLPPPAPESPRAEPPQE